MMEGHEKATYKDLNNRNDCSMEVNWNSKSGDSVKITIGDKEAVIKYDDLYGFIFLNANAEQMEKIIPTTQTVITKFTKMHVVQAKKNISKGERLQVRCEIDVPTTVVQALRGDIDKVAAKSPFIAIGK